MGFAVLNNMASKAFPDYPLQDIASPHDHDVLYGKGGRSNNHKGNRHWRMVIAANKQSYRSFDRRKKKLLAKSIVKAVRSQNPPGRFLQFDSASNLWFDVGDQRALDKTSQALREKTPEERLSPDADKTHPGGSDDPSDSNSDDKHSKSNDPSDTIASFTTNCFQDTDTRDETEEPRCHFYSGGKQFTQAFLDDPDSDSDSDGSAEEQTSSRRVDWDLLQQTVSQFAPVSINHYYRPEPATFPLADMTMDSFGDQRELELNVTAPVVDMTELEYQLSGFSLDNGNFGKRFRYG